MTNYFKLIRPFNLLIIALTMIGMAYYFEVLLANNNIKAKLFNLPFIILVISTVMIAAGGNIINDYFDVKADRINRPKKLIIGKHIKRRWAIINHWGLNFVAFMMAIYLSYELSSFWYLFIHLLSINLLWYYSVQLKRTAVVGNVVIAFLTGLVPVLVGIFYAQMYNWETVEMIFPFRSSNVEQFPIYLGIALGLFAFFLNWTREIIKDIEDIEGDKVLCAKTLPITFGIKNSKKVSYIILFMPVLLTGLFFYLKRETLIDELINFIPILLCAPALIAAYILIIRSTASEQFHKAHTLLKLIMVLGIALPVYWAIIM
jgi:4-hydroxybenzoate polyprenyltransferase